MATLSAGLLGDENDLLSMNLLHLFGSKLDNKFPGSSFHWVAFHLEIDGVSRCQCPRKFKGTHRQSAKSATEGRCIAWGTRHLEPMQLVGKHCALEPSKAGLHLECGQLSQL